jgi:hypothetical protein
MIPAAPIVARRDLSTPWRRNFELWAFPGFHHKIISVRYDRAGFGRAA